MTFITHPPNTKIDLQPIGNTPAHVHLLEENAIHAINAALGAGRPLLVRGEPGTGKSQLARAAAKALGRAFIPFVVDARTESRDLLWHFDAVERLAQAQLQGALCTDRDQIREQMHVKRFIAPGPLWWAFNWDEASDQAIHLKHTPPPQPDGGSHRNGCVVLIDEIDKAESDVPNGLLEALGVSSFQPQGLDAPVTVQGTAPLLLITTNEERTLPDAFLRRCFVLPLDPPDVVRERETFLDHLIRRGAAHFPQMEGLQIVVEKEKRLFLQVAAELVAEDRVNAIDQRLNPLPGVAEYLDLLRSVIAQAQGDEAQMNQLLHQVRAFAVRKHNLSKESV